MFTASAGAHRGRKVVLDPFSWSNFKFHARAPACLCACAGTCSVVLLFLVYFPKRVRMGRMSYNQWLSALSTQHIVISSCAAKWFSLLNSYSKDGHAATSDIPAFFPLGWNPDTSDLSVADGGVLKLSTKVEILSPQGLLIFAFDFRKLQCGVHVYSDC